MSGIKSNLHTWIQNKTLYISQHILFCGETNNSLLPFWIWKPDPFVLTNWFHWVLILPEHVCEYVKKKGIQSFFDTKTSSHWIVRSLKPCFIRRKLAPGRGWHKSEFSKWKCLICTKFDIFESSPFTWYVAMSCVHNCAVHLKVFLFHKKLLGSSFTFWCSGSKCLSGPGSDVRICVLQCFQNHHSKITHLEADNDKGQQDHNDNGNKDANVVQGCLE